MGTQDSLDLAQSFVERHSTTTPLMTWDSGFETWEFYNVRRQPTLILVDADGNALGTWNTLNDEITELIEAA